MTQQYTEILEEINKVKINEEEFDGSLLPKDSWDILQKYPDIPLIDIRTQEERVFTGYVESSLFIPWATGTSFHRNPRFLKEVEHKTGKDKIIFLICRSGNRSHFAAKALKQAGFEQVYHVIDGFEGDLNDKQQRNQKNGWKFNQLPWIQS